MHSHIFWCLSVISFHGLSHSSSWSGPMTRMILILKPLYCPPSSERNLNKSSCPVDVIGSGTSLPHNFPLMIGASSYPPSWTSNQSNLWGFKSLDWFMQITFYAINEFIQNKFCLTWHYNYLQSPFEPWIWNLTNTNLICSPGLRLMICFPSALFGYLFG